MTTLYLLCSTQRTGSTLLHYMLRDAGLGDAQEYLHGKLPSVNTVRECAARIRKGNHFRPVMGWRVMWGQLHHQQLAQPAIWEAIDAADMLDQIRDTIGAEEVRYIYLTRRDHLRQAVSVMRAKTGVRWYCPAGETPHDIDIPFDAETIKRVNELSALFERHEALWEEYFSVRGITPLRLIYEDMTRDDNAIFETFWRLWDFISPPIDHNYLPVIPLEKQAGADVENWIAFYEHLPMGKLLARR